MFPLTLEILHGVPKGGNFFPDYAIEDGGKVATFQQLLDGRRQRLHEGFSVLQRHLNVDFLLAVL
ncbi:hypothetical protein [Arthrobacter sp. 754]|uniref:hypothetical protein n=1 Tax=Arthrobacter sp. 754 TaxID=3156315 RepID=UPI00339ABE25